MLFVMYLNRYVLLVSILLASTHGVCSVVKTQCGNNIILIKTIDASDLYDRQFKLYYMDHKKEMRLFYKTEVGMGLYATCVRNKQGNELLLFREFCSGNACPENVYGVFDLGSKKIIINPADWPHGNSKEINKIIKHEEPFFNDDKGSFCCGNQMYGDLLP